MGGSGANGLNYSVISVRFDHVTFLSSYVTPFLLCAWCFLIIHFGNQTRS